MSRMPGVVGATSPELVAERVFLLCACGGVVLNAADVSFRVQREPALYLVFG